MKQFKFDKMIFDDVAGNEVVMGILDVVPLRIKDCEYNEDLFIRDRVDSGIKVAIIVDKVKKEQKHVHTIFKRGYGFDAFIKDETNEVCVPVKICRACGSSDCGYGVDTNYFFGYISPLFFEGTCFFKDKRRNVLEAEESDFAIGEG
jgi:hypothetical protein